MNKKKALVLFLLIILGIVLYFILKPEINNDIYKTETAQKGTIIQTINVSGPINPVAEVKIGSNISGIVKKVYVDFNSKVKKGDLLLELDKEPFEYQLQQSTAQLNQALSQLNFAQNEFERTHQLYKKEYASKQEFDKSLQLLETAKAQTNLWKAQKNKDLINYNYHKIYSPINGIIIDKTIDVGQVVAASFQSPILFRIAENLSKMQIYASVSEADVGYIKPNTEVSFKIDAFPEKNFIGKINQIRVLPTVQQNVVTYTVIIDVNNQNEFILPGMTANVSIPIETKNNVLKINSTALRYTPNKYEKKEKVSIFILENNKPKEIKIKTGLTSNEQVEILEGLTGNEKIIIGVENENSEKKKSKIKFSLK